MYIIAIAWLYVTVLMAATEKSVVVGVLTFLFYGLIPCAILLWVLGAKHRRFKATLKQSLNQDMHEPNRHDPKSNE
jgi:biotin transporter BioY